MASDYASALAALRNSSAGSDAAASSGSSASSYDSALAALRGQSASSQAVSPSAAGSYDSALAALRGSSPAAAATPSATAAPTPAGTPSPNPIDTFKKDAGTIGSDLWAPIATAFHGIMFGLNRPGQAVEHAISKAIQDAKGHTGDVMDVLHAAWQGLSGQTPDVTGQQILGQLGEQPGIPRDLAGLGVDVATDPLTYVPFADLVKLAKVPEAANLVYRLAKESPVIGPRIQDALDFAGKVFDKYHGISKPFRQAWQTMEGRNTAAEGRIGKLVGEAFKGATPEERAAFTHAMEKAPGYEDAFANNPRLAAIRDRLAPVLAQNAQDLLGRKLLTALRENYMPHILHQRFQNGYGIWANVKKPLKAFLPASMKRKIEGSIKQINEEFAKNPEWAAKSGLDPASKFFEDDAAKLLYSHLLQSAQAKHLHDFLQTVLAGAKKVTKKDLPLQLPEGMGLYRPNSLRFFRALLAPADIADALSEDAGKTDLLKELHPGMAVGSGPAYMLPKAEADFLNGASRHQGPYNNFLAGADAFRSLLLKLMLVNPFVHFPHNVLWNAYQRDPMAAINPSEWMRHIKGVIHGVDSDPWLKRATEAGAVPSSAILDYRGPIATKANQAAAELDKPKLRKLLEKLTPSQISQGATWVPENAMRVALFRRAVQRMGMSDADAADWVNQALGNPKNLSNTERWLQRFLIPFYNWEKTAVTFNLGQLYNHTARGAIPLHVLNAINESIAGHPMSMNPTGKQFDLSVGPDAQGNQRFINVYNPLLEALNIGNQGVPTFLFRRMQSLPQSIIEGITGQSSPPGGPTKNFPLVKYPELQNTPYSYLNDVPLFRWGNLLGPEVSPYTKMLMPDVGVLQTYAPPQVKLDTLMQIAQLLGMFPSVQQKGAVGREQSYQNRVLKQEIRSAIKARAREGLPITPPNS